MHPRTKVVQQVQTVVHHISEAHVVGVLVAVGDTEEDIVLEVEMEALRTLQAQLVVHRDILLWVVVACMVCCILVLELDAALVFGEQHW